MLTEFKRFDRLSDESEEKILTEDSIISIKNKLLKREQNYYTEAVDIILTEGEIPNWKLRFQGYIDNFHFKNRKGKLDIKKEITKLTDFFQSFENSG